MELADNDQLRAAMDSINMRLFVCRTGWCGAGGDCPEHLAILQSLRRRDPDGAEAAMRCTSALAGAVAARGRGRGQGAGKAGPAVPRLGHQGSSVNGWKG